MTSGVVTAPSPQITKMPDPNTVGNKITTDVVVTIVDDDNNNSTMSTYKYYSSKKRKKLPGTFGSGPCGPSLPSPSIVWVPLGAGNCFNGAIPPSWIGIIGTTVRIIATCRAWTILYLPGNEIDNIDSSISSSSSANTGSKITTNG